MISKHRQSTYHDTLNKIDCLMKLFLRNIWIRSNSLDLTSLNDRAVEQNKVIVIIIFLDVDNIVERVANIMTAEDQQSLSKTWRTQFEE